MIEDSECNEQIGVIHEAYKTVQYVTSTPEYRNYIDAINKTDKLYEVDFHKAIEETGRKKLKERLEKGKQEGKIEEKKQIALNIKNQINSDRATIQINSDRIAIQGLEDDFIAKCLNISIEDLNFLLK